MIIDNLISEYTEFKYMRLGKKYYFQNRNVRDSQMAKNLEWLCKIKYPEEKIIVWAHNFHISKYNGHYSEAFLNKRKTMGGVFTSDSILMKKTYILGFTSYDGTAGRLWTKPYKLPKPKKNSFENWIPNTYNYAFIDFQPFRIRNPQYYQPFYMAGSSLGSKLHTISKAEWYKIFDGVFFIRNMYPCKQIKN